MTDEITVMVVDDHPIWREGVARDLTERGLQVVATAPDAAAAVRIALATRPQVVLMDLNLGGAEQSGPSGPAGRVGASGPSGVQAIEGILAKLPATKVLVLSASGEHADVLEAVKAGATGYLVKSAGAEELLAAVRRTAAGFPVFTPGLAGLVLGEYRRLAGEPPGPDGSAPVLTDRETEVLRLVAKGLTARQIGDRLVVSHRTVESHVQNTLRKLQLHNRAQLVRYAIEQGLTDDE
jgi:DNA-binding NarL/FixJ family response regulator